MNLISFRIQKVRQGLIFDNFLKKSKSEIFLKKNSMNSTNCRFAQKDNNKVLDIF